MSIELPKTLMHPPVQRETQASGLSIKDELQQEIAQEEALLGHDTGVTSYAKGIRRGYRELAQAGFVNVNLHEFFYNGHNLLPWLLESTGLGGTTPLEMVHRTSGH